MVVGQAAELAEELVRFLRRTHHTNYVVVTPPFSVGPTDEEEELELTGMQGAFPSRSASSIMNLSVEASILA